MFQPSSNPIQISRKNRTQKRLESPHLLDYQADRRKVKDKYGNKVCPIVGSFEKKIGLYQNKFKHRATEVQSFSFIHIQ